MKKWQLGILDCDELSPELEADYHCYASMFQTLFGRLLPGIQSRRYQANQGELPDDVDECDAYLISGSKAGVYDALDWLPPLRQFIEKAYVQEIKLLGICFGHQLLADTLGGKAEKSSKGWGVGAMTSRRYGNAKWMDPLVDELCLLYSHQDQVSKLPTSAERILGSDFCQFAGYQIPGRVLAFQGHPEFTRDYCARLMMLRKQRYAPGQYEQAMDSLSQTLDDHVVTKWMINFLHEE